MANTIGPHTFLFIYGDIPSIGPAVEMIETPGEDNYALRHIGKRSRPFPVQTVGTYNTEVEARNAHGVFADMVGENAVSFEKDTVFYTAATAPEVTPTKQYRVNVLDVAPPRIEKTENTTGRDWEMTINWTLILEPV